MKFDIKNLPDSKDIIMLSQFFKEEKKEKIRGFHVLSDGSLLKVHNNQYIEIRKGPSPNYIEIEEAPTNLPHGCTLIAELPNHHLALAYCLDNRSLLVILDLKNGIFVANIAMQTIRSLISLANGFMLINADTLCIYNNNCLTTTRADQFIDFSNRQPFDNRDDGDWSFDKLEYVPLPSQSGFIYFDRHYQSTIKVITDQFEKKAEFQFRASPFIHLAPPVVHGQCNLFNASIGFCYGSQIVEIRPLSHEHFACLTRIVYYNKDFKFRLYIINRDMTQFHQKTITGVERKRSWKDKYLIRFDDQYLFRLDDQHVAVVDSYDFSKICVKIYNLKCEEIKKIIIDKKIYEHYIAVTPNGQLITCSLKGEIVIHHIFTPHEKLKKETESVLMKNAIPTEVVSIVTEYAGLFFGQNREVAKDGLEQIDYPEEPTFFARLKVKP